MTRTQSRLSIPWLLGLASFALLGIIGLQGYWLRQSVVVKEEQFEAQVSEALASFSRKLQKQKDVSFLLDNVDLLTDPSNSLGELSADQLYKQPDSVSLRNYPSAEVPSNPGVPDGFDKLPGEGVEIVSSFSEQGKNYSSRGRVVVRTSVTSEGVRISRRIYQLDSVFLQIVQEEYAAGQPLENQITRQEIDSLLHAELSHFGIHLPYAFGIYDEEWLPALQSGEFDEQRVQFKVRLFPDRITTHQGVLGLYFPYKRSYLLRSIWGTLALGGLFTAAIVITFGSSLRTAMRQKRLSEMKTDFINNMTHEFKTPIATISLALDAMKNEKVRNDQERMRHYSELIRQENKRMNQQVEDVLRLAMLDRQELELDFEVFDLHDLIEDVQERFQLKLQKREGELKCELEALKSQVQADRQQMEAVLSNLLDNALKYSPEKPNITVRTTNVNNEIVVSVSDHGIGMSAETQRYIFDRFYRSETGNVHNIKGHGLGLAFVKGVLLVHDSNVHVKSSLGKGSTFSFNLKIHE